MKIQKLVIALLAFGFLATSANARSFSAKHDAVVKYFQSSEEPSAKDAIWTAKDIFKVGVINDGKSKDGYAAYVCEILTQKGFKDKKVWVQVIDIVKLKRTGKWVKLGECHCR